MLYSKNMSELTSLECPECGELFNHEQLQTICLKCDSPLLCHYDLVDYADSLDKEQISSRPRGLWRWHELLPVRNHDFCLTLGEGDTALLPVPRIAAELGVGPVFVKDEGGNPTGTFKARGLAVAVSRAKELGAKALSIPTAGNAGGALAAYAARAEMEAHVFMPADAPLVYQIEVAVHGGELVLVDGLIDEAGRQAALQTEENGWFGISTFKEPYRVEGKKTMGFELAEAFNWELPEVIIYPTGGGTGSGKETVRVSLPIGLVNIGMKMGARFVPEIEEEAVMEDLAEALTQGMAGKIIDIVDEEDGERVEIFIE